MYQIWPFTARWCFFDLENDDTSHWLRRSSVNMAAPAHYDCVAIVPCVENSEWDRWLSALALYEGLAIKIGSGAKLISRTQ